MIWETRCSSPNAYAVIIFGITLFFNSCSYDSENYLLYKLVKGKIAYEIPDTMDMGKNYKATVIVTKAMNDSILFQNFNPRYYYREKIKVSSIVNVFLIDPTENNFNITSLSTAEQLVDDSTNTVWKWNITPKRSGNNELVLRVTAKVFDRLGENYKDIKVFEKTIKVNAPILTRIKQFVSENWKWLSTVIVIPLILWVRRTLLKRKQKNAEQKNEQQKKRKEFEEMILQSKGKSKMPNA